MSRKLRARYPVDSLQQFRLTDDSSRQPLMYGYIVVDENGVASGAIKGDRPFAVVAAIEGETVTALILPPRMKRIPYNHVRPIDD